MQFLTIRELSKSPRETLTMLQKLEFMQNLTEMRQTSVEKGSVKMTLDEINSEITAARKNKRAKPKK